MINTSYFFPVNSSRFPTAPQVRLQDLRCKPGPRKLQCSILVPENNCQELNGPVATSWAIRRTSSCSPNDIHPKILHSSPLSSTGRVWHNFSLLEPFEKYEVTVYLNNSLGASERVTGNFTTNPASSKKNIILLLMPCPLKLFQAKGNLCKRLKCAQFGYSSAIIFPDYLSMFVWRHFWPSTPSTEIMLKFYIFQDKKEIENL